MHKDLPAQATVIVIGGGIMGCSTLYHLARMGVTDAILVERNKLTSGTTWHSAAQVRALRHSHNLTRMIQYSAELYQSLEKETGQSVGWIQEGSLSIATCNDRLIHIQRQAALAQAFGIEASAIPVDEAAERWPLMNTDDVIGAVWSPDDGRVSPSDVCAALIKGARALGAQVYEDTAVTDVSVEQGRLRGLETSRGFIRCDAAALCAGLWSREVGAMAGVDVPLLACEHYYLLTRPVESITGNTPTLSDHDSSLYIRDDSGGLLIGCFEPHAKPIKPGVLDASFAFELLPEDWDHFEPMMSRALHRLPVLASAEVRLLLNGPESFTPDGTFMLGETAETQGFFLGCGMNSVGIASGGGAGMNLAHCIVNGRTAYDLSEADAQRFAPAFNSVEHLLARAPEILGSHYEIAYPSRQYRSARRLRTLPLDAAHQRCGAYQGQFYDWERPLYFNHHTEPTPTFARPDWFAEVGEEVQAAQTHSAVFDLSSFGNIDVAGPDAETFMLSVCAGAVHRPPGTVIYTAVLTDAGTYQSDVTVQRLAQDHYRVYTGTAAIKRDMTWFSRKAQHYRVDVTDTTAQWGTIALMGPRVSTVIQSLNADFSALPFFRHEASTLADIPVQVARLSYVGEFGWEISCHSEALPSLYDLLLDRGVRPAGLLSQTSMRIEKGFRAMGHELDSDVSPVEAGLLQFTRTDNNTGVSYIGSDALKRRQQQKNRTHIVSLCFDDEAVVPIGHEPVGFNDNIIGLTTSCAFGYRLNRPVALASVSSTVPDNTQVEVSIAGHTTGAVLTQTPPFDPTGQRMRQPA